MSQVFKFLRAHFMTLLPQSCYNNSIMKHILKSIVSVFTLLAIGLTGCSQGADYITVHVDANACLQIRQTIAGEANIMPWSDTQLVIEIDQSGKEPVVEYQTTDNEGYIEGIRRTFELRDGGDIKVRIIPTAGNSIPEDLGGGMFDPNKYEVSKTWEQLRWLDIYPANDLGDTYNWTVTLRIRVDLAEAVPIPTE